MTRLISSDITEIADRLQSYDVELLAKTGRSLLGIACHASGAEEKKIGTATMLAKIANE